MNEREAHDEKTCVMMLKKKSRKKNIPFHSNLSGYLIMLIDAHTSKTLLNSLG